MVERIRTLLEARQLTPTQFADAIGVARPIVSHILSGRNKPSLEVVQRILAAMPDLSMPWLLNGTGPMLAVGASEAASPPAAALAQPSSPPVLAPAPATPPEPRKAVQQEPVTEAASLPKPETQPSRPRQAPKPATSAPLPKRFAPKLKATPAPVASAPNEPAPVASPAGLTKPPQATGPDMAAQLLANSEKPIRRIVIFYRDGSFADYQPE
ncbi:helix-turn-helix domain-containing protein [Hymenobacter sp. BT523]|uniref:helix-turn-helix domain-containing protein n=1 Tax=Hymenobacter sp. BT523 TaxID=2795725 RepID=UPI0018EA38F5|nr:helix-turn-helix domain-containing protein [Hymenobacter sp. BT523]